MIGEDVPANLWYVPARQVGVDAVHEGRVVAHFGRKWSEEVPDALLMLNIDVKVADQNDASIRADALAAAGELAALHVTLHDVDPVLLVEGHAGHLIEAHDVVLTDQAPLSV